MASMLRIELPEIVSKTPIPSGNTFPMLIKRFCSIKNLCLASNTLDPMNLTRSESRNTMGPSFKLQMNSVFTHTPSMEDEKQKITDQVCLRKHF